MNSKRLLVTNINKLNASSKLLGAIFMHGALGELFDEIGWAGGTITILTGTTVNIEINKEPISLMMSFITIK